MLDPMATAKGASFSKSTFQFLAELGLHNERAWFEDNKDRYEAQVREPARAFIRAMAPKVKKVSPHLVASDKKVGGSLMRIHRDVRFSKDKSPYKTNVGIQFRHEAGKDVHAPGIYVHLEPGSLFIGMGLWHPPTDQLAKIRASIVESPTKWTRVRDDAKFSAMYELQGSSLKRPPRGVDPEHPLVEDLKRKDFIAVTNLAMKDVTSTDAADRIGRKLMVARPFLRYLCRCVDVAF
jgi:uncharacterized protein (TIGR02453 family)